MHFNVFIIFIVSSLVSLAKSYAGEQEIFPPSKAIIARQIINDFLGGKQNIYSESYKPLSKIPVYGLSGVHLSLALILNRLEEPDLSWKDKERVQKLLLFASRLAQFSTRDENEKLRTAINLQLNDLLHYYRIQSRSQEVILEMMDRLELWSAGNLWFFKQYIKYPGKLASHYHRLQKLLAQLRPAETADFVAALKIQRPLHIAQLGLLLELGELSDSDRVSIFKIAASKFDHREIHHQILETEGGKIRTFDNSEEKSQRNSANQIYISVARKLIQLLRSGDPQFLTAYFQTKYEFERQASSMDRNLRLIFLKMLMNEHIKWTPELVQTMSIHSPPVEKTAPVYQKDGNVLTVHFGLEQECKRRLQ